MANLNDHKERFRLGHKSANPFQSNAKAHFGSDDVTWCPRCKMVVDHETESTHNGTEYFWKQWCKRCGKVISYGHYTGVPIIGEVNPLWYAQRVEWLTSPGGKDRRKRVLG